MSSPQLPLGALLVQMGFVTEDELAEALATQERTGLRLGKVLIQGAVITEDRLVHALSQQLAIEACDPIMTPVHEAVLGMVPSAIAFKHRILPVARQRGDDGEVLYVATADPLDQEAAEAISQALSPGTTMRWMLAGETEMDLALARHYGSAPSSPPSSPQVRVIQGSPIAPPRRPEDQLLNSLNSTGDIFAALQEAVEFTGNPAEAKLLTDSSRNLQVVLPPVPVHLSLEPSQSAPAPVLDSLPPAAGPADSHTELDLARLSGYIQDDISGDILEAEEVIESGVYAPEALRNDSVPQATFPNDSSASDPSAEPIPAESESVPVEEAEHIANDVPEPVVPAGPSWGDLLGADASQDEQAEPQPSADAAELALAELNAAATILPSARESLVVEATALPEPAEASSPSTVDLERSGGPESLAELGLEDMPHPPVEAAIKAPEFPPALDQASPDDTLPADAPPNAAVLADAIDTAEELEVAKASDATGSVAAAPTEDDSSDIEQESSEVEVIEATEVVQPRPEIIAERPQGIDAPDIASTPAVSAHAGEVARSLVRQFVAGAPLSDVESKWVMRVLAGAMLQSGLLEDDAIAELLVKLGPPPGSF